MLWGSLAILAMARTSPALSLLNQELHRQRQGLTGGCASVGEWAEQYSAECGESGALP